MHIAFAIVFFVFIELCETLRHGVFGLNDTEISRLIFFAMGLCALLILRSDVIFTMRESQHALYGSERWVWTWRRTALGLALAPIYWLAAVAFAVSLTGTVPFPVRSSGLSADVGSQILAIALVECLFFREAVIKAFSTSPLAIVTVSGLATFIFHVPLGPGLTLVASGVGLACLALRMIGMNILVVAGFQAVTILILGWLFDPVIIASDPWAYGAYVFLGAAVISLLMVQVFAHQKNEVRYA